MAIVLGNQDARKRFLNYTLQITRTDLLTGERIGVEFFKLRSRFRQSPIDPSQEFGRVVQGAADGGESTLAVGGE